MPTPIHVMKISPSIVVYTIGILLAMFLFYTLRSLVLLFFLAFVLSIAITPTVTRLEKYLKLPRSLAIPISYLLLVLVISTLFLLVVPPLANQLYLLVKLVDLPIVKSYLVETNSYLQTLNLSFSEFSTLLERLGSSVVTITGLVSSTFSSALSVVMLIVLSYYFVAEQPILHKIVMWFTTKDEHVDQARHFLTAVETQIGSWVRGQLILMSVIGVATYLVLSILSVPYALPLALLAGFLEIVPNIGPVVSAVPIIFTGYLAGGWVLAVILLVFCIVLQQVENTALVPRVMKNMVNVNPLVTIAALLVGLNLAGAAGAVLAIPSYLVLRVTYQHFFRRRVISFFASR